jgi:hypothetical protein
MPTLDETLAQFYPSALTALPAADPSVSLPAEMPDPVGVAIDTLRRIGATTAQNVPPPQPMPLPVGPAAPQDFSGLGAIGGAAGGALGAVGDALPQAPVPNTPGPVLMPEAAPPQPAPLGTPLQAPGSLPAADQQLSNAVDATGAAMLSAEGARQAAETARASRQATAIEEAARLREEMVQGTMLQRQKNEAAADLETAAWIQELQDQSAKEPNPSRWWQNQSRLGKALWAIGMLSGAVYAGITPGAVNVAFQVVRQEVAADMEEQRARLARSLNALKAKGSTLEARHARMASDLRDDYTMGLGRIEALERAFLARAVVPGDMDAAAAREQVIAQFAQLKLPYVEQFRKEKLDSMNRAEERKFQRSMQASAQAHARSMQEDEQSFTKERDKWQHEYRLAESPVTVSAAYQPGGPIPTGKDGLPILSELQADGLVLKDNAGKPVGGHGKVRVRPEKFTEASDVIAKANRRYTATQKLLTLLEDVDPGLLEAGLGNLDPALQSAINDLGYAIAKEHDPRITNQDFSKGVEQAMGFDMNGGVLSRGKAWAGGAKVKEMLRAELNAMPEKVNNTFRTYNDAAINGQSSIVWDPDMLAGEKVQEKNAREIRGERALTIEQAPVAGVKDYETKRAAERDPDRRGYELPPHDTNAIHAIIDTAKGNGPATVRAKAEEVLEKLREREAKLTEKVGNASAVNQPGAPPYASTEVVPSTQTAEDFAQLERVRNTIAIAESVAKDAEKRATSTVKSFESAVTALRHKGFVSEKWIRDEAGRRGIADEAEVRRVIDQFKDYAKSNLGKIERGSPLRRY